MLPVVCLFPDIDRLVFALGTLDFAVVALEVDFVLLLEEADFDGGALEVDFVDFVLFFEEANFDCLFFLADDLLPIV